MYPQRNNIFQNSRYAFIVDSSTALRVKATPSTVTRYSAITSTHYERSKDYVRVIFNEYLIQIDYTSHKKTKHPREVAKSS